MKTYFRGASCRPARHTFWQSISYFASHLGNTFENISPGRTAGEGHYYSIDVIKLRQHIETQFGYIGES